MNNVILFKKKSGGLTNIVVPVITHEVYPDVLQRKNIKKLTG
jgi:hypothetical protein